MSCMQMNETSNMLRYCHEVFFFSRGDLRSSVKEEVSDTAQTLKRLEETAREPGRVLTLFNILGCRYFS